MLILAAAIGLLTAAAPVTAQACPINWTFCPGEMNVTSIACKDEAGWEPVRASTCPGYSGPLTPTSAVDVDRFAEIRFDERWNYQGSLNVTLSFREGSMTRPIYVEAQETGTDLGAHLVLRNVPTHLFPLLADRCALASDPASREFTVEADATLRLSAAPPVTYSTWPITRPFRMRIAADGFVNPPHCL